MQEFEQRIAYFYGAKQPEAIASYYIQALQTLEQDKKVTFDSLIYAYQEVARQTQRQFDISKAAQLELALLAAHQQKAPFEEIQQIMTKLYTEVFQKQSSAIYKAAAIRTFLYQYKCALLARVQQFSEEDKAFMLMLAEESEKILASVGI